MKNEEFFFFRSFFVFFAVLVNGNSGLAAFRYYDSLFGRPLTANR